tara:strand:+ start:833 stop:1258 length:426 start_codon:yes stop_codon:yes gene_type:complete
MELASLNKKHEEILQKYVNFVKSTVFEATDDYTVQKFIDFNEIIKNIINYTNSFNRIVKTSNRRNEWAYMTPNLMLYATMGFLAGIKNDTNESDIDDLSEELFETTVDFIGETTDILQDIQTKEILQKELLTMNKKNEHNN